MIKLHINMEILIKKKPNVNFPSVVIIYFICR